MGSLRIATVVAADGLPGLSHVELANCRLPVGFRFPVTDTEILEAPLLFLHGHYVKHRKKGWDDVVRSEHAASDDLYEWFAYLGVAGINWTEVHTDDVLAYRNRLESSVSPRTRQLYKANTIRRRLGTILKFHGWADRQGFATAVPHPKTGRQASQPIDSNAMAHLRTGTGRFEVSDLLPSPGRSEPSPFANVADLRSVLLALGPEPRERERDLRPSRNRLAATFALVTGARLSETLAVTLADVLGLRRRGANQLGNVRLLLTKTKGGAPRKVLVPNWLLDGLLEYAETERAEAVAMARAAGRSPAPNLFLNGTGASNRAVGRALTARTMSRYFQSAVISAGLCKVIKDETGAAFPDRIVAEYTFHDLRHTFAVLQYLARKARGDAEPWKAIATLLGHRSVKTTMDFYLRSVSLAESDLSDVMSDYIGTLFVLE